MSKNDIVIVGCGGFAREVEFLINRINEKEQKWNFLGYIDNCQTDDNIIGTDDKLLSTNRELYVAIAIGDTKLRKRLFTLYKKNNYLIFPNLVDPSAIMSSRIDIGIGNILCAGTILTVDINIGDFNIINLGCTVGHDVTLENFITINPGTNISGNVYIESETNIGTGCQVIQGKQIGMNTYIGAGAVVINDIPNNCTAVGVPAKIIKIN